MRGRAAGLVLVVALAGCMGAPQDRGEARDAGVDPGPVTPATVPTPLAPEPVGDDFAAHHHNYWGPRTEVTVFDDAVTLDTFPLDGVTYEGCNAVGFKEFDFEDDGEDVSPGAPPVNPDTGRADAIFPGTESIRVVLDWDDPDPAGQQTVDGLVFQYRPANQRLFQADTSEGLQQTACGAVVPKGKPFHVPVKPLQFDPAHQTSLSRWEFRVWAYGGSAGAGLPAQPPTVGLGAVRVLMVAVYGGETLLDPPHPDFFGGSDRLDLGVAAGQVDLAVVADPDPPPGTQRVVTSPLGYRTWEGMTDITFPRGHIAPLGMERVAVRACVTYTGAVPLPPGATIGLAYHGADDNEFVLLEPSGEEDGCPTYSIDDPQGLKADSPYETVSQWGFRLVPVTQDLERVGVFEGDYALTFAAYRNVGGRT